MEIEIWMISSLKRASIPVIKLTGGLLLIQLLLLIIIIIMTRNHCLFQVRTVEHKTKVLRQKKKKKKKIACQRKIKGLNLRRQPWSRATWRLPFQ